MKEAHLIYSLSSSNNQLSRISYSLSRDKGSEAVKSCNSGDFIHPWYLQKKYKTPVVNTSSSRSSSAVVVVVLIVVATAVYQVSTKSRTTEKRHIGHPTNTSESINAEVQNIQRGTYY